MSLNARYERMLLDEIEQLQRDNTYLESKISELQRDLDDAQADAISYEQELVSLEKHINAKEGS